MPVTPKRVVNAWAMYDWANSAYNLVITSTIFPMYYVAITTKKNTDSNVYFFGHQFINTSLSNYCVAAAYLIIVILSPILSSIADYKGNKKAFMQFFCYIGGLSCCGLYFLAPQLGIYGHSNGFDYGVMEMGMICFMLAAIGYCGSLVFYNAYLPEIAEKADQDKISAKGFAYGYVGSVVAQLICLVVVLKPTLFGITDPFLPSRISFIIVGVWWIGFAQIPFKILPKGIPVKQTNQYSIWKIGFVKLKQVWKQVKQMPVLKRYLRSFFFYSMGLQTVMLVAAIYGSKELELSSQTLIVTILIIQLVAILGSYLMSKLSSTYGNLYVLASCILIWIIICIAGYFIQKKSDVQFYILGGVVGLVMGGIQSLSRSTYSKLMPVTKDTASFFSYYDVTEKLAIVIGMFSFGFIEEIAKTMRNSVLILAIYFFIAFILMIPTIVKHNNYSTGSVQN